MTVAVRDEIASLLEARSAAIAAQDVDAVIAQVADDVVTFDVGIPLQNVGSAAVRERLEQWFAGYRDGPGFEIRDLAIHGDGDVAFSRALIHVTGTLSGGESASMWVRSTIGWERRDGSWQAVHEHMSDPMDFETGMARTDLAPG